MMLEDMEPTTPEKCRAIERAICGAIGWLSAGANEANNGVYQETHRRLVTAAGYFARKAAAMEAEGPDKELGDDR